MQSIEIITNAPVFSGLEGACLRSIADLAVVKRLAAGDILFVQGRKADGLYVIGSGEVEVFCANSQGKEQILHVLGAGELCAEVPLFQGGVYPASARAYTAIEYCYIDGVKFIDFACENPEILLEMLAVISMRTKKFLGMVESLSLKDVTQRLAAYLLTQADKSGVVRLSRSKLELASELGTIPETLSRSLRKLIDIGAITPDSEDKKVYCIEHTLLQGVL